MALQRFDFFNEAKLPPLVGVREAGTRLWLGFILTAGPRSGLGSVDGVLFVFVAVVIVVVGGHAAGGEAVQREAGDLGSGFAQEVDGAEDGFARGLAGLDDEDGFVGVGGEDEGVAHGVDGGGVDDDAVVGF